MFRITPLIIAFVVSANCNPKLTADDSLNTSETRWLEMLREQIPQVSDSQRETAIEMTVVVLTLAGREPEATEIAMQQANDDAKNALLISIAGSLAQRGAFDRAMSAINVISDPRGKERATHEVARALASEGDLERAESLLKEVTGKDLKERILEEICERLARDGRSEEALARSGEITNSYRKTEVVKLIERIRDGTPSPLEQLSGSLGQRVKALTAFSPDGAHDSAILAIVAAKAGDQAGAMKYIRESIGDLNAPQIPDKKVTTAILVSVALVELRDKKAAGDFVEKLYESVGGDWSGLSTLFGGPILMSLLVQLERFDAIDQILAKKREGFESDPTESWYLYSLETAAESLVEQGHLSEFESRLARVKTPEEKLYLLMGAIIGADYARRTIR